jgi:hypothetical protein
MSTVQTVFAACFCLLLAAPLSAQIYQSKDADGNPVFSDNPSPGAAEVDLNRPNVADSVEVRPLPAPAVTAQTPSSPPTSQALPELEGERLIVNSNDNERRKLGDARPKPTPHNPETGTKPAGGAARGAVRSQGGGRR